MTTIDGGTKKRAGRGLTISGIVLMLLGVVSGIVGIVLIVTSGGGVVDLLTAPMHTTPFQQALFVRSGITFIYQDETDNITIPATAVQILGPSGQQISTYVPAANETITINGVRYRDVVGFVAPTSGDYHFTIIGPTTHFIVGPSLGSVVKRAIPGIALIGLGVVLFIIGVVFLIVGLVKRSRSKKAVAAAPSYGYYDAAPGPMPVPTSYALSPPVVQPTEPERTFLPPVSDFPAAPASTVAPTAAAAVVEPAVVTEPDVVTEPAVVAEPAIGAATVGATTVAASPFASPAPVTPPPSAPVTPPPSAPVVPTVPAGWYPDSQRPGGQRYWDGTAWTEHRA